MKPLRLVSSLRRIAIALLILVSVGGGAYQLWRPGSAGPLPGGRHGVWLTHAWWGDDAWFVGSTRQPEQYRGSARVQELAADLRELGLVDWYVHACPCAADGSLPGTERDQARLLVAANPDGAVLAWVGGVLEVHCHPADPAWRRRFASSCAALVADGGLAGIQLNIEPCPSFTPGYLELLDELRSALPTGARLSLAAYPPPSAWHPAPDVHWNEDFYRAATVRCDDIAVMAYDTALHSGKTYTWLVREWTREVLDWSAVPVRIGLPAYEDDEPWHDPRTETLEHACDGVAAALPGPAHPRWAGAAVYAEWTLDAGERELIRRRLRP